MTLTDPAPNVFRFASDSAQFVAGLGAYAYDVLGWRKAAIVADDNPYSWGGAAGFTAEFCALGGRIVDRSWIPFGTDPAAAVPHALRADGVYLGLGLSPALGFVKRYTAVHRDLAQRLVSSATLLYDPSVIARPGESLSPGASRRADGGRGRLRRCLLEVLSGHPDCRGYRPDHDPVP